MSLGGDVQSQHLKKKEKSNFTPDFSGKGVKKKMRFDLGLLHNMINIFLLTFFVVVYKEDLSCLLFLVCRNLRIELREILVYL